MIAVKDDGGDVRNKKELNGMQQLEVSLSIPVPENFILIEKVKLKELKQQSLLGAYWTMEDLEEKTKKKHEWIKENILYPSRFRRELDVQHGGFVFYPEVRGQVWSFHALKMSKFLDDNFNRIFKK